MIFEKSEKINTCKLSNGMRVIHKSSPTNVAYCGIAIDAGTRDERPDEYGIAHFCEHLLFKGTQKRKAWHILNRMEAVGGDLNAYTTKEETFIYAAFMRDHLSRAIELICDVVFRSTYPQHEMDKEAEVIVEEIESYQDSPAELIFDDFENMLFENHELGHDILGDADRIRSYKSEDLQRFVSRLYKPENMVFFVFGNYDFRYVKTLLRKVLHVEEVEEPEKEEEEKQAAEKITATPRNMVIRRDTHQAHVMMGCVAYPAHDERRVALYFLNNIIGGPGMNSILNVALREHKGLVYTVESTLTNYTDTSTFAIYFGCDAKDVEKCVRIVEKELKKLSSRPLSESKFKAAMKQIKGQIGVACDNFENYALDMAKSYLHYHKFDGIEETFELLDKLTPQKLQEVANDLFASLSTLQYI